MGNTILKCLVPAALLALAACATPAPSGVPAGAQRMSAEEIGALLAQPARLDNDIVGGLTYRFAPDGNVAYSMRMLPVRKAGQWKVDAGRLCIRVDAGPWDCGALYRLDDGRYYFDLPDYDRSYNTLSLRV